MPAGVVGCELRLTVNGLRRTHQSRVDRRSWSLRRTGQRHPVPAAPHFTPWWWRDSESRIAFRATTHALDRVPRYDNALDRVPRHDSCVGSRAAPRLMRWIACRATTHALDRVPRHESCVGILKAGSRAARLARRMRRSAT